MSELVMQVLQQSVVDQFDDPQQDNDAAGQLVVRRNEHGMVSAEWAVGIIAAVAIAGVLLAVITHGEVKAALLRLILFIINQFSH